MRAIRVPVPLFQEVATRRKDSAGVHHPLTIRVHIFALGFAHSHWAAQPELSRVSHLSPHFNSSTILVRALQRTWPTSSPRSGVRLASGRRVRFVENERLRERPTPGTPPCVRVRTRRFETVTLTFLEQRRESQRFEVCLGKPRSEEHTSELQSR